MSGSNYTCECPKCKSVITLRGRAMTLALTCATCGVYFRRGNWNKNLTQFSKAGTCVLPVGSKGRFENFLYEVMGFTVKEENKYHYQWREYLLFNPYRGYAFLSEYDGHWNFVWGVENGPLKKKSDVAELKRNIDAHVVNRALVYEVQSTAGRVMCSYFDAATNTSKQIRARAVILCTPQFITQRILKVDDHRHVDYSRFEYAPWMVANIVTTHPLSGNRGEPLCWDNVIYGSDALGYVNASHQQLGRPGNLKTITYYKPLIDSDITAARRQTHNTSIEQWQREIVKDLSIPHPDINRHIEEINVWLWGHGMIRPSVNFIWNENRFKAQKSIDNRIFFAHSDLSGVSIFEEAFYQGHRAAKEALLS